MQSAISKNSMTLEQAVGQQFLLTFEGREAPPGHFMRSCGASTSAALSFSVIRTWAIWLSCVD